MKLTQENLKKELLSLNDSERRKIYDKAQEIAYSRNLAIDGQKLPFITVPFLVEKTFMDDVLKKFDTLTEALILLEKYALSPSGKAVYDRLMDSLTEGGRELVNQCKFESDFSLKRRHRRFDSYISPSSRTASVIEVNQAAPLALSYHDTVQEIGDTILDAAGFQMQKRGVAESLLQWFIDEFQERNPKQLPKRIALVIEHGYPPKLTDLPMISERIMKLCNEKFGYDLDIITCFPYEITLKDSDAFFHDEKLDVIWRNSVYMTRYRENGDSVDDYLAICREPENHLLINATRVWLTRNKETFAILSDSWLLDEIGITKAMQETLKEIIPYTVNPVYDEVVIQELIETKDEWITKPSDAGFGAGVEFGANHTPESWLNIIRERSSQYGYVFQKRVPYPQTEVLDITADGKLILRTVEFDFCPHHINGSFTGTALSRANIISDDPVINKMNLVSGGYLLPIMAV